MRLTDLVEEASFCSDDDEGSVVRENDGNDKAAGTNPNTKGGDDDDNDDEPSSTDNHNNSTNSGNQKDASASSQLAARETVAVNRSKLFMYAVLLTTATAAGVATYMFTRAAQENDFEREFDNTADELFKGAENNAKQIFGNIHKLGETITSFALGTEATWPMVMLPNFDIQTTAAFEETRKSADLVLFSPKVWTDNRTVFEDYAVRHQGWVQEDLAYKGLQNIRPGRISNRIHTMWEDDDDVTLNFSAPLWQLGPVPTKVPFLLTDLYSHAAFRRMIDDVEIDKKLLLSEVVKRDAFVDTVYESTGGKNGGGKPRSFAVEPVFNDFSVDAHIAGYVFAIVNWDSFFYGILPENIAGDVFVEIDDTCGKSFCFRVDEAGVSYMQKGCPTLSQHTRDASVSKDFAEFARFKGNTNDAKYLQYCNFGITVLPSQSFYDYYVNDQPKILTGAVVVIFLFTIMVFAMYDVMVARRQDKVMATATRTTAIVKSLFPTKDAQDQIMQQAQEQADMEMKEKKTFGLGQSNKLKSFLQDDSSHGTGSSGRTSELFKTKPIADLFPEVTVLFADISGFTSWSSTRDPAQVFTLLENIFAEFDAVAKARKVFKVETVGDCYVAVCGLPEKNRNHASTMARFARDCMFRVASTLERLEITLGPETSDLNLRFGMHSGPVTAGVLRGERARFQLFGDTMNTAARMESTGKPGRIQISEATAGILSAGGKGHWLRERGDRIVAKGKGEMKTFWLEVTSKAASRASSRNSGDSSDSGNEFLLPPDVVQDGERIRGSISDKDSRLVAWNTEILLSIMRDITARRSARGEERSPEALIQKLEQESLDRSEMAIDEVSELIDIPSFDNIGTGKETDVHTAPVDETVAEELHHFLAAIASTYNENPFHSFEHAGHVTMSVTKLLGRIVTPEQHEATTEAELHDSTYGIASDPLTRFAVVLSALIHDADHSGVPNAQLVNEQASVARAYNNRSPAEQNSLDICWTLLLQDSFCNLRKAIYSNVEEFTRFRKLMVNTVLATDIVDKQLKSLRNARWEKAFCLSDESTSDLQPTDKQANDRKATIVIEHLIQASDVAHTMQHWHIYRKWNERFFRECYKAYKEGRAATDPSIGWYKGEIGFFDFYIIPLAKKLKDCGVFGVSSDEYLDYALKNRQEWENKGQELVEEMLEKMST